jgi:hypothetical protein
MLLRITILLIAALAIGAGWYQMFRFAATPGAQGAAPERWPRDVPELWASGDGTREAQALTLLVFIHPRCSCTVATLEQLDQILQQSRVPVRVALVVYHSEAIDREGISSRGLQGSGTLPDLDLAAARLLHRSVKVVPDLNGGLARRFGAATSGETVLYAANGQRLFQGGITAERAHVGQSAGGDALRKALTTGVAEGEPATVFGCPIFLLGHAG